jgi:hypothetical protein
MGPGAFGSRFPEDFAKPAPQEKARSRNTMSASRQGSVLVTGGAGYIGSHMTLEHVYRGEQ